MSITGTDYRRGDPRRVCDICGHLWHKSELTRIAPFRWACPDDVKGLTAEDISRHNASVRPLMVKAVKNAKGLSQTPTYQQAEAVILNLVLANAPNSIFSAESGGMGAALGVTVNGLDDSRACGWMAFYLGNLVLENRRPTTWIARATDKLSSLCDQIVANQFSEDRGHFNTDFVVYGGIGFGIPSIAGPGPVTKTFDVLGTATCLLGLLRGYQATGATRFIVAARRCAYFLRSAQCCGLFQTNFASPTGGGHFQPGPFPLLLRCEVTDANDAFPSGGNLAPSGPFVFGPQSIICAWALDELRRIDGDGSYGSTTILFFSQDTHATLSSIVSQCVSWWANGARDGAGAITVGFGPATPKDYYAVTTGGSSTWSTNVGVNGQIISGYEYASGIRALFQIGGYTDQVAGLYEWLRSFSADPSNAEPSGDDAAERSTKGTYDPTLALARFLRITDQSGAPAATEAVDVTVGTGNAPGYDWRTVGMLAPIQSIREQGDLRVAKDTMSIPSHRRWQLRLTGGNPTSTTVASAAYDRTDQLDDLRLLTFSGLSRQTSVGLSRRSWGSTFRHLIDLEGAAVTADAYRYAPQAFPLEQG